MACTEKRERLGVIVGFWGGRGGKAFEWCEKWGTCFKDSLSIRA